MVALWPELYLDPVTNSHDSLRSCKVHCCYPISQTGKLRNKEIMPVILVTLPVSGSPVPPHALLAVLGLAPRSWASSFRWQFSLVREKCRFGLSVTGDPSRSKSFLTLLPVSCLS